MPDHHCRGRLDHAPERTYLSLVDVVPPSALGEQRDLRKRLWDLLYHGVVALELLTYRMADVVMATNGSYRRIALDRGRKAPNRVFVLRSAPDLSRFAWRAPDPAPRAFSTRAA